MHHRETDSATVSVFIFSIFVGLVATIPGNLNGKDEDFLQNIWFIFKAEIY